MPVAASAKLATMLVQYSWAGDRCAAYSADVPMAASVWPCGTTAGGNASRCSLTGGADQVQGFIQLVHDGIVGVCKTPSAVDAAMAKVKVTWRLQQPINQNEIDQLVDVDAALAQEQSTFCRTTTARTSGQVDLRFDVQVQSHAAQEPRRRLRAL